MSDRRQQECWATVDRVAELFRTELRAIHRSLTCHDQKAESRLVQVMDQGLVELAKTGCWGPENRLPSSRLWSAAEPWLSRGEMQLHARSKPRGYAGDFELLDKIYRQHCCDDPLGRLLDSYFHNQAAPRAVRDRRIRLSKSIASVLRRHPETIHIASVGSGPATEVLDATEAISARDQERCAITLLDMDPTALTFAREQIEPHFRGQLIEERTNLGRLTTHRRWSRADERFDFVYCAGLFDYLEDEAAMELIQLFHQWLKPDGQLVIFNFDPSNPTRCYMEWIGNWYLNYRDVAAVQNLLQRDPLNGAESLVSGVSEGVLVEARVRKQA